MPHEAQEAREPLHTHFPQDPQEPPIEAVEKKEPPVYYKRGHIPASLKESLKNIGRAAQTDLQQLRESEDFTALETLFPDTGDWLSANDGRPLYALLVCFTTLDTAELIQSEYFKRQGGKPSLADFTRETDGESKLSEFFNHIEEREGKLVYITNIDGHKPKAELWPTDKLNANIWSSSQEPANGKYELTVLTGPSDKALTRKLKGNKPAVLPAVAYSIDFGTVEADFPFVKRLTRFDKRVLCGVGAMMDAGQDIMSIDEIYYSMGYTKAPGNYYRRKINESLTKMTARVHIDNKAEIQAGMKYKEFKYDGDFLAFERMSGVRINGKDADTAIHVFQYPKVLEFARRRKQVQTLPMPVLQSGKSKTEGNLAIEDYLIQRISEAKRDRQPQKILYETMYRKLEITGKTERQRMRATAAEYMAHYVKTGWIQSYKTGGDGLTFEL